MFEFGSLLPFAAGEVQFRSGTDRMRRIMRNQRHIMIAICEFDDRISNATNSERVNGGDQQQTKERRADEN